MSEFSQLSAKAQIYRLRQAAFEALKAYPFEVKKVTLLYHGFNTTFRVDTTSGQKYALRINLNSQRTIENVHAEMAWLDALSRDTDIPVVKPVRTQEGQLMQMLQVRDATDLRPSALFQWIPGPLLEDCISVPLVRQLGQVTAQLHQHAATWTLPEGCSLPETTSIYLTDRVVLFDDLGKQHLSEHQQNLFRKASEDTQKVLDRIHASETPPMVLHTDLHDGNLKVWKGTLQVFDFDDCALGHPIQDVANALYYLNPYPEHEAYHAAFREGYEEHLPWTFDPADLEALMAARGLLLLNGLLCDLNPDMRTYIPVMVEKTTQRMTHWRENGTYRNPTAPAVVPA